MNSNVKNDGPALSMETWKEVIKAIEDSIPLYDQVNDAVSFGKAQVARSYALQSLELHDGLAVLDGGIGPGSTSKLILSTFKPSVLVGLDQSVKQLEAAKLNLGSVDSGQLHPVRASFEYLPFKQGVFDGIITCYALRDSLDLSRSLAEYSRVCSPHGSFADVDIGKPDNLLKRWGSIIYVKYIMPILAKIAIGNKIKGNPWKMIAPTIVTLPQNRAMLDMVRTHFAKTELKEFLAGGIIVIIGRKSRTKDGSSH
jgi:demethylmenaquinone methyltransferase/2-methoxy-6-polyprenyl-1,4-benzoquinol methylase